jgi:membrane protein required for colicin V production
MSIIDIILLICLVPAIINGVRKGFISQVISIVSIIAGVWVSFEFASIFATWISQYIQASENILSIVAFALIMVGVFVLLGVVGRFLESIVKFVMLGWLNKLLGIVFSLLKSGLIIGLVIMVFSSINNNFHLVDEQVLAESALYTPLKDLAYTVFPYLKSLIFWN